MNCQPFISQSYWIPGPELKSFHEYWATAKDLDLVQGAEVLPLRNTQFISSPFDEMIQEDGNVEIPENVDNECFVDLLRQNLHGDYEVRIGERIAASPLVVPLVLEHLWRHCSSNHVWQAIRAKGDAYSLKHAKPSVKRRMKKKGVALELLRGQWNVLLQHFDEVFMQPVVFWPLGLLRNCTLVSFTSQVGSDEAMIDLALKISQRSVVTTLMPGTEADGACRIWCNPPSDRIPEIMRLIGEYHSGPSPPSFGIVDLKATRQTSRPAFCGFDWQTFDASDLSWQFSGEDYIEKLKGSVRKTSERVP